MIAGREQNGVPLSDGVDKKSAVGFSKVKKAVGLPVMANELHAVSFFGISRSILLIDGLDVSSTMSKLHGKNRE